MTDYAVWQEGNTRYLSAATTSLRRRLEKRAGNDRALPDGGSPPHASAGPDGAAHLDPPPAFLILCERLGLSSFERDVLLLCAAMELDTGIGALCAQAQNDPSRPHPTFALALALFDDPAWDALSPERPLRYWRLIEITETGAAPLTGSPLRADERIVNYVKGLNHLDGRLLPMLTPLRAPESVELPPSQRDRVESIVLSLHRHDAGQRAPVIHLVGSDESSKRLVASHVAHALGLHLYRLPAGLLPPHAPELETVARLWQRESLLLPVALYLDALDGDAGIPADATASAVRRFLGRANALVFLDTPDAWPAPGESVIPVDVGKPTPAEQRAAWAAALGQEAGQSPALLAGQFNLNLEAIQQIAATALADARSGPVPLHDYLWSACQVRTRPRLDALAQRLEPKATWDDIVLPDREMGLLKQLAGQVGQRTTVYDAWGFRDRMNRGLGITALFSGESGTGKTMAAEVIANSLRLNLYRIDLSAVVSKYIGETEKNLRRLFDAAEDGGAVLFFDEADALFGKRSEVKDSHDRYANIEVNYLLQRMESYRGLAILATNMKSALDSAFLRRLRFIVTFPFPNEAERASIWRKAFPSSTPTQDLDCARLAHLNLTGGSIHAIALNAAFLAAGAGAPVTMPFVLQAARAELRKLERPLNEADFQWRAPALVAP